MNIARQASVTCYTSCASLASAALRPRLPFRWRRRTTDTIRAAVAARDGLREELKNERDSVAHERSAYQERIEPQVMAMWDQGMTARDIAQRLAVSEELVNDVRDKFRIAKRVTVRRGT